MKIIEVEHLKELKKKYKQIYKLDNGNYLVSTKNSSEVNPIDYFAHTNIDEIYGLEGNWGLVDKNGNVIIAPKYIYPFIECGENYQVMLPCKYKTNKGIKTIVALKHGLIDKKGNIIIPIKYLYMEAMDNTGTYFRAVDNKTFKSGIIDKNNNIIVPFIYEFIQASPDFELMTNTKYCHIYPDYIYQVKVSNDDLYGIYDLKLKKEIIKPKFKHLKIIDYNRFIIGDNYDTIIDEKEQIIEM